MKGDLRHLMTVNTCIEDAAIDIAAISTDELKTSEMLVVTWTSPVGAGREIYTPKPYKSYDLLPADLKMEVTGHTITLTANGLSLFTSLEADTNGRFSDNAFDMLPHETRTITFTPTDPSANPNFTLRDLHSATTA
jgi:beta-mannosidase